MTAVKSPMKRATKMKSHRLTKAELANDQEPIFFIHAFTIGAVLLCIRMSHMFILPYMHPGGMPLAYMYTGAVVKNKNSSSNESKEAASKEAADTEEERWIFLVGWV